MSAVARHAIRFREEVEIRCDQCGEWLALDVEFWLPSWRGNGLMLAKCRACKNDHREAVARTRRTDELRARERASYARRRDHILAYNRKRYAARREAELMRGQLYRASHRRAA